jgi:arabinofuranosyltransferase
VPVTYEVFRMGYYASPVPNTGLAKGASTHFVFAGVDYLQDLAGTYWLWVPLIPLVLAVGTAVVRGGRAIRIAVAGMVAAGLLHGAYIVYIGGDYMHGRLLLPALFALALPGSLLVRRAVVPLVALAVGVGWAVVCAGWIRYENPQVLYVKLPPITDRRTTVAADERVVRKDTVGEAIDEAEEDGLRGVLFPHVPIPMDEDGPAPSELDAAPASKADGLITFEYTIGVLGYQAGPDVRVVDLRGLADPLAARGDIFQAWRLQAGHRKFVDPEWYVARYGFDLQAWPDVTNVSAVAAARRALACPPLSELIDGVEQPLTPGRFLSNLWHAASFAGIRIPVDPRDAKGAACGTA